MARTLKRLLLSIGFVLLAASVIEAACGDAYCSGSTCTAPDASWSSVAAAVSEGRLCSGDVTINVPADTQTWNTRLTLTMSGATATSLHIKGAGGTSTEIVHAVGAGPSCNQSESLMEITLAAGKTVTVSGIYFNGSAICADDNNPLVILYVLGGGNSGLRITGNQFTHTYKNYAVWTENAYGVIDNNTFHNGKPLVKGPGSSAWAATTGLGGANFLFVENNTFTRTIFGNAIDTNHGGRFVFRYNTVTYGYPEVHAYNVSSGYYGGRAYEVYNNLFLTRTSGSTPWLSLFRSGGGVVANNAWNTQGTGTYSPNAMNVDIISSCTPSASPECTTPHACVGGIGMGLYGTTLEGLYAWNNTKSGSPVVFGVSTATCANAGSYISEGTDFFSVGNTTMADAKADGLVANYTYYTCPHHLVGTGTCDTAVPGRSGYSVSGGAPSTNVLILGGTGSLTPGAGGTLTLSP